MVAKNAKCFDCGELFQLGEIDACPQCNSSVWAPYDPDYTVTRDVDNEEFSGSKAIDGTQFETHERANPQPDLQELHIRTTDEWEYVFRAPNPDDGYELHEKRCPDETISEDDVVPISVAEYIDEMSAASLNYAKLVVHPSHDIYTPPSDQ